VNLIHIGLPKTASTTLQDRLFSKQERFLYLGRIQNGYSDARIKELLERVAFQDSLEYDARAAESLVASLRASDAPRTRPIIVSAESLSVEGRTDRRLIAERLHKLFAPAKVLIVLRAQPAMLQSLYLNDLRGSGQPLWPFDVWLERLYGGIRYTEMHRIALNYEPLVRLYDDVFGQENVTVLAFEQIKDASSPVFDRLAGLVQVDRAEVSACFAVFKNQRMSRRHMLAMRVQGHLPAGTNLAHFGRRVLPEIMYRPIRSFVVSGRRMASPTFSAEWCRRIASACAAGNSRIAVRKSLPLESLGYPIIESQSAS